MTPTPAPTPAPESPSAWDAVRRWRGVILIATISIATIWFAAVGKLIYYVHPRYLVFSVIMSVVALLFCAARVALAVRASRQPIGHDHDHEDDDDPPPATRVSKGFSIAALAVAGLVATAMISLPPATLSSATALQRDITSTSVSASTANVTAAQTAANSTFAHYSVLEWSSLLQQTSDLSFYSGKPVDVIGFVTPDPKDSANVFYVTRFVIACCAVDAQPVGIPVYSPNWKSAYPANSWVRVTGSFVANRSTTSAAEIALAATGVKRVAQPTDPYLY